MNDDIINNQPNGIKKRDAQLFKYNVPINILLDFLKNNFIETDAYFIINKFLYKKTEYNNTITIFLALLKDYYYTSKKKYVERNLSYKHFLTVIRQLCNTHNMMYESKLIYDKSSYEIEYKIYKVKLI